MSFDLSLNELANEDVRNEALNAVKDAFSKYVLPFLDELPLYNNCKITLNQRNKKFCLSSDKEFDPNEVVSPSNNKSKSKIEEIFWVIRISLHFKGIYLFFYLSTIEKNFICLSSNTKCFYLYITYDRFI